MFLTFVNFALFLFIASGICNPLPDGDGKTTTNNEEVEKKIDKLRKQINVISNPAERENLLLRMVVQERQRADEAIEEANQRADKAIEKANQRAENLKEEIGGIKTEKANLEGIIGAVVGREALESFRKYAKKYLPTKIPMVSYTAAEYQNAYFDCFMDTTNQFGKALLERVTSALPNMDSDKLAVLIRKMYGKCSHIIHSLHENLVWVQSMEKVLEFIQAIPATLSSEEKIVLEKIGSVLLDFDESYTEPPGF